MELLKESATTMARAVREGEVSPVELVEAHIRRAEELDGELNAIVLPRFDQALEEARAAEQALGGDSELGPLHGVPYTAKECIEVAGMPCTDASRIFEGNVSVGDAVVVESLRDAGAILLGKTNIPEFALHYDSNNLVYGATRNPHDAARTCGGSSGGEGAAIASGMSPFGVGSDYGGSIRIPSSFCGIVGIKPGRYVVPYSGHFPPASPISIQLWSQIGPMARYIEDLELLLPIFARTDSVRDPDVPPRSFEPASVAGLAVGVFYEDGLCPVEAACREAVDVAARALEDAGHDVVEERPPQQAEVRELFLQVALAETAALMAPLVEPRRGELSPQMRRIFDRVGEADTSMAGYAGRLAYRVDLERAVAAWLERHPIAVCPVSPIPPFELGAEVVEIDGQPVEEVDLFPLCTYVNLLGLPGVAVPTGRSPNGLPLGVQVIGRRNKEMEVLAVARELEGALGGWVEPQLSPAHAG